MASVSAQRLKAGYSIPATDPGPVSDQLLGDIVRHGCLYFYEMADPGTGLVLDRAAINYPYKLGVASIAATGFGLSALTIADRYGYLHHNLLRARVCRTLEFLADRAEQTHGFFYHFLDAATGKRAWKCEVSSVDTAWLLCGALHCRAYWDDPDILTLAQTLLNRADWAWMLNSSYTLAHGWAPECGFLPYHWDAYSELLAMYLLALSSENHPIPPECWNAWKRPMREFEGIFFIDATAPLFVHQYSHAWFDFRNRVDRYANYFNNSQRATQAHRQYCIELAAKYPWYGPNMWGVTASDSPTGYRVWGGPGDPPNGSLVPCAAGGSIAFLPRMCAAVLETMLERYGKDVWCQWGFVDAFQPEENWYSRQVIGIDLGIMVLMAENLRTGSVWEDIMATPEARRGMLKAGLQVVRT